MLLKDGAISIREAPPCQVFYRYAIRVITASRTGTGLLHLDSTER